MRVTQYMRPFSNVSISFYSVDWDVLQRTPDIIGTEASRKLFFRISVTFLQEFFARNNLEIRGSSRLPLPSFVTIMEKMFKGCTELPQPPRSFTKDELRRRNKAVLVRRCFDETRKGGGGGCQKRGREDGGGYSIICCIE